MAHHRGDVSRGLSGRRDQLLYFHQGQAGGDHPAGRTVPAPAVPLPPGMERLGLRPGDPWRRVLCDALRGLQNALAACGGVPCELRTDRLAAVSRNCDGSYTLDITPRYQAHCHYGLSPSRNNRGVAHENVIVEAPHGDVLTVGAETDPARQLRFPRARRIRRTAGGGVLRWVPFTGQLWPLQSLTPGERDWVHFECRRHRESFLPVRCGDLDGSTSTGSGQG